MRIQKEGIRNYLMMRKYMSIMTNTINYPKWYVEKKNVDNSLLSKLSYVTVPFTTIDDKTITISDDEIQKYINDHKEDFEQKDETRTISFVSFSATPTAGDSATWREELDSLKPRFAADTSVQSFVSTHHHALSV